MRIFEHSAIGVDNSNVSIAKSRIAAQLADAVVAGCTITNFKSDIGDGSLVMAGEDYFFTVGGENPVGGKSEGRSDLKIIKDHLEQRAEA